MNGASAEVCANTSSAPTRTRSSRIGASHHFFRTRSSAHTSRTTLAWLIACASSEQTFHVTPTAGHGTSVLDRKSTRLNSSHGYISYAVFCLKKKNTIEIFAVSEVTNVLTPADLHPTQVERPRFI